MTRAIAATLSRIDYWYFTKAPTGKPRELLPPHMWRAFIDQGMFIWSVSRAMPSNTRYYRGIRLWPAKH